MNEKLYPPMAVAPEDVRRIQQISFDIYKHFAAVCDAAGLRYFFCGGCCIGALRHRGFIPWDDDVDVFMPRPDYERLMSVWESSADNERYKLCRTSKTEYTRTQIIAIHDTNTTFIKTRQCDLDTAHGVRLEIIPLDGSPKSAIKRKIQMMWALIFSMFVNGEAHTSGGKIVEIFGRIALAFFPTVKTRYKVWRFAERQMSKYDFDASPYTKELCVWYEVMQRDYPSRLFSSAVLREFEGVDCPIPVGYDEYLKMAFSGDYMQLPPKESRIPKHEITFYDLDHGYERYKGIKYNIEPVEKKYAEPEKK